VELTVEYEEEFVGVLMHVPDVFAQSVRDPYVIVVHAGHDPGAIDLIEGPQRCGQVHGSISHVPLSFMSLIVPAHCYLRLPNDEETTMPMTDSDGRPSTAGGVNDKDEQGLTALHRASGLGDPSAVRGLLQGDADPAILDSRTGASPLHHAAQSGSVEVAALLLEAGAFLNLQAPRNGVTPLMAAVWYRMPALVAFLLQQPEIDVEQRALFGATAAELIGFGASADDEGAQRQSDQLRALFADYAQRRDGQLATQPLFVALTDAGASTADRASRVRELLDAGHREVDTVSPVLSSGSDGHTPLLVAARDGDTEAVAALLAAGADQTAVDHYMAAVPAHKAAYGGHAGVLRLLAGAPGFDSIKNAQGPYNGYTPLHDAVWHGHFAAAEVLVHAGVRTDLTGLDGRTAADLARQHGYQEIVDLLQTAPSVNPLTLRQG